MINYTPTRNTETNLRRQDVYINPGDLLAIGFPDIDYEYLELVKYLVATSADIAGPADNFR